MRLLDIPLVASVRRNHAVEHATIHMLARRQPHLNAIARTTLDGFHVYGEVDTRALGSAAAEGLARLQTGEAELAVHPRCGTNLAVAGFLAGVATFLAMGRAKSRLSRFPRFILAATLAVVIAQPLGLLIQEHITTSPDVSGLSIKGVRKEELGRFTIHKVELERSH